MGIVSGPTFAEEVARGLPAALTVAATEAGLAATVAALLRGESLRAYESDDIAGVEIGGAIKNVLAIAAGASDGLGFGHNARAALITRGLAETGRLSAALGGKRETLMGLAGLGDLVLTCTGDLSRNRRVGLALAKGQRLPAILAELGHVAEGVTRRWPRARWLRTTASRCPSAKSSAARCTRTFPRASPWKNCFRASRGPSGNEVTKGRDRRTVPAQRRRLRRLVPLICAWSPRRRTSRTSRPPRPRARWSRRCTASRSPTATGGWRTAGAEVQAWTRAQHAATLNYLDRAAPPVPGMKDELTRYFDRDRTDAPFFKHGREFFKRIGKGEPQAKLYTRIDGKEVLLFDPMALDPSGKTRLGIDRSQSRRDRKLAVGIYSKGSEIQDIRITDSRTGAAIGPLIVGAGNFHWARDERYRLLHAAHRRIGREAGAASLRPPSPGKRPRGRRDPDPDAGREEFLHRVRAGGGRRDGVRYRRLLVEHDPHPPDGSSAEPKTIYSSDKFRAQPSFRTDRIYFRTNFDAPNWKVMAAGYDRPEFAAWTTLIPEQRTVLDDVTVTNGWIVVQDREDVLSRLSVYDKDGKRVRELPLPVFGNVTDSDYDRDTDTMYATLASHTAPYKEYALDGKALDWKLVWQDDPPLDLSQIVAERVYVRRTMARRFRSSSRTGRYWRDGSNPTLLNGYGGFNKPSRRSTSAAIRRSSTAAASSSMRASAAAANTASGGTNRRCWGASRPPSTT